MSMKIISGCLLLAVAWPASPAQAQLSRLLREGVEFAGKRVSQGAAKTSSKAGQKAVKASARMPAKASARSAGRLADDAAGAVGRTGAAVSDEAGMALSKSFGAAGVRASGSLSNEAAGRLVLMSDELAASGRQADWLSLIAERGDQVVQWLWTRRGSIAVGTAATAVVLAPEDFVHAAENFASGTVEAVGEHLVEPLITESAAHLVEPLAAQAASAAVHSVPWNWLWGGGALVFGVWYGWRRLRGLARK